MGDPEDEHTVDCAQRDKIPCPANTVLHSEQADEHWWSGWPGAFCMKCGTTDMDEQCIGNACACPCHDEFNAEYARAMRGEHVHGWTNRYPWSPVESCECGVMRCGYCKQPSCSGGCFHD